MRQHSHMMLNKHHHTKQKKQTFNKLCNIFPEGYLYVECDKFEENTLFFYPLDTNKFIYISLKLISIIKPCFFFEEGAERN